MANASIIFPLHHSIYGKEAVEIKRVLLAAGVLCAVVYLKLCIPGFSEEFMPQLQDWLAMEQVSVVLPEEGMNWLILPWR